MIILLLLLIASEESAELIPVQPMIEEINPVEYVVGPGDVLWFSIQGGVPAELSGGGANSILYLTVTPDGYAVIPST
ncbi:MAG: hypothetical protein K8S24_04685, partial [Candidatus Aegiribacteria sp.]|nr:hypothetical protein [Candidatus Aegiribacteria sp.]